MSNKAGIIGKILVDGELELTAPLMIGAGKSDSDIDCEVLKNYEGVPYIPGTALAGAFRHYFYEFAKDFNEAEAAYFWGAAVTKARKIQSAVIISDAILSDWKIVVRDGVAIDEATGMTEKGKKYNYEVVEPGATAKLFFEVTLRKAYDKEIFEKIIVFLLQGLQAGEIKLGAITAKGLGEVRLIKYESVFFDFTNPKHVLAWLARNDFAGEKINLINVPTYDRVKRFFEIDAQFTLKSSLIVRTYNAPSDEADAVQLTSGGKTVIPGTSLKGALRSRANFIGRQFGINNEEWLNKLMGIADEEVKIKSRLFVKECHLSNVTEAVQTRIRIDRFTGGVIKTALFNTKPVWCQAGKQQEPVLNLRLIIYDYQEWEAGLLLMLLKDLWTGRLALGGEKAIGRGVLQGLAADITAGRQSWHLKQQQNNMNIDGNKKDLEKFTKALIDELNKAGGQSE